ncbi:hypothetical protein [Gemmatimonas sp.]|uniref:hypothetical protein n=1 Tax=Gemmatimonas sp. TaxID=1962908 RepID=UPI00333F8DBD
MIAFVGYGDVSGRDRKPIAEMYTAQGRFMRASRSWPLWSEGLNNSISMLSPTSSNCGLAVVEALGRKYGTLHLGDAKSEVMQDELPWSANPAQVMSKAIASGAEPSQAGRMIWINAKLWQLNGDTALVRQDSITQDRARLFRYALITKTTFTVSKVTDIQLWEMDDTNLIYTRFDENGRVYIGRAPTRDLLIQLSSAYAQERRSDK